MKYSHVYPASVHELPGAKIYMIDLATATRWSARARTISRRR